MTAENLQKMFEARDALANSLNLDSNSARPILALVLGSGLSHFADNLKSQKNARSVLFNEIPHLGSSTVEGHKGEFIAANLQDRYPIIIMSGRLHFYEGFNPEEVVFPIRLLGLLGIKKLILTNAAGAVGDNYEPGQLMLIKDHINLTGHSPLIGPNISELGPRFVDMTQAYDAEFMPIALEAAKSAGIIMHKGVYAGLSGPCYETPAEIRMMKIMGADAVGMSTVFETMIARQMGMRVLGISCLTNKAAGLGTGEITHEEVMENNAKVALRFGSVLSNIIARIA